MDRLNAQQRHANMAAIHSKDTKPEIIVRRGLWAREGMKNQWHCLWQQKKNHVSEDRRRQAGIPYYKSKE